MTAATPPPHSDEETCAALVAELDTFLRQWRTVGAIPFELAGIVDRFRPAAPSEPPAADSPTPGIEVAGERTIYPCRCWGDSFGIHLHTHDRHFVAPSPVDTTEPPAELGCRCPEVLGVPREHMHIPSRPPAETQQDDERVTRGVARALWTQRLAHDPSVRERTAFLAGWDAALAARPSADTEALRRDRAAQWIYRKVMRARAGDLIIQIPPWEELTDRERAGWLAEADSLRAALDAR